MTITYFLPIALNKKKYVHISKVEYEKTTFNPVHILFRIYTPTEKKKSSVVMIQDETKQKLFIFLNADFNKTTQKIENTRMFCFVLL